MDEKESRKNQVGCFSGSGSRGWVVARVGPADMAELELSTCHCHRNPQSLQHFEYISNNPRLSLVCYI